MMQKSIVSFENNFSSRNHKQVNPIKSSSHINDSKLKVTREIVLLKTLYLNSITSP